MHNKQEQQGASVIPWQALRFESFLWSEPIGRAIAEAEGLIIGTFIAELPT